MTHRLAPGHHIAIIDDRTVALDVTADRYRLFGPRATRALQALMAGEEATDGVALDRLASQGLLASNGRPIAMANTLPPSRGALEMAVSCSSSSALPFGRVVGAVARASWRLQFRGLRKTLDAITGADGQAHDRAFGGDDASPEVLAGLAQSFARQRRYVPIAPVCLRDSIALHALLSAAGHRTVLVIAVRLAPFAAHCWLQAGDLLLNDSRDNVSGYTPILVL